MPRRTTNYYFAASTALALIAGCSSSSKPTSAPTTTVAAVVVASTSPVAEAEAASPIAPTTNAPTTTAPVPVPTPVPTTCPPTAPAGLTCATVAVPVDPSKPSGPTLNVAITMRRADGSSWASPILVLNGTAPNYGSADPRRSTELIGHDLVFIDQRGIGRSDGAVACTGLDKYTAERNELCSGEKAVATFKACLATQTGGPVPVDSIFNHDVVASDIGVVRRALGIDRWSVDAPNGGVDIALRMVSGDPGTVASIATRSPQVVGIGESPNTMADGFDRFAADCAAATTCSANGDLKKNSRPRLWPDLRPP